MQQIIELVNEGGSALTIDTLDYNEYERIEKGHFPEHVVSRFHDVVDELDRNLKEFLTDSEKFEVTSKFWEQPTEILLEELATELAFEEEKFEEAKKQKSVIVPFCPKHKFVIACKRFMMRLFSESGECSFHKKYEFRLILFSISFFLILLTRNYLKCFSSSNCFFYYFFTKIAKYLFTKINFIF